MPLYLQGKSEPLVVPAAPVGPVDAWGTPLSQPPRRLPGVAHVPFGILAPDPSTFAAVPPAPILSWFAPLAEPPRRRIPAPQGLSLNLVLPTLFGTIDIHPGYWYVPLAQPVPRRIPVRGPEGDLRILSTLFVTATPNAAVHLPLALPPKRRPSVAGVAPFASQPGPHWGPTGADSLRIWFTTGVGGSYGSAQAGQTGSLGGYRSASEAERVGFIVKGPLPGIQFGVAARANGTGTGSIAVVDADRLSWTAPDSLTPGPATFCPKPVAGVVRETVLADGLDPAKWIRIKRTSSADLAGAAIVELTDQLNNVFGQSDVPEALSAAGGDRYRAVMIETASLATVTDIRVYVGTLGAAVITSGGGLPGSGAGTVTGATDAFAAWDDSGWGRIEQSNGTLRELVYWTRTRGGSDNVLSVPAAGRGLFGTAAAAGLTTDRITPVPGERVGAELASPLFQGSVQTLATESTAPNAATFIGGAWSSAITAAAGVAIGSLTTYRNAAIFQHRGTPAGIAATPRLIDRLVVQFTVEGRTYVEPLSGLYRVQDTDLRRLEMRAGVDGAPALDAAPVATQAVPVGQTPRAYLLANPWTPNYVLTTGHTHYLVTDFRDEFGQRSDAIQTQQIKVAGGVQVPRPPSDPEGVRLTPAAGGKIRVQAVYYYDRDTDTGQAADQFALWYTTDGSTPNPAGAPTATVAMAKVDGAALLLGPNGEPYWPSPTYGAGTVFKLIIRTRRSGDTVTSTNSTVYSATAATSVAGTGTGKVFYRQLAEQLVVPPFSPAQITGLKLWLKADAITGLNDGDPVATWTDSSGLAHDASQATGAQRPTYKVAILNGYPIVRFDGVDDNLVSNFGATYSQPNTLFAVVTRPGHLMYVHDGIDASNRNALFENDGTTMAAYAGAVLPSGVTTAGVKLFSANFNGGSSNLYMNGSSIASGDAGSQALTGLTVGSRYNQAGPLSGDIAEVLVYNSALSAGDRQLVEAYLNSKYGLY